MSPDPAVAALEEDMRDFAYWKSRRDDLIRRGLAAGMSIERVSAVMDVAQSAVRRVRDMSG